MSLSAVARLPALGMTYHCPPAGENEFVPSLAAPSGSGQRAGTRSNADRQRAYRERKRNAVTAGAQAGAVTLVAEDRAAWLEHRRCEAAAGVLNPYQLRCCAIKFGTDWLSSVGFSEAEAREGYFSRCARA